MRRLILRSSLIFPVASGIINPRGGIKMPLPKEKEHFTYSDYYEWDDGERWELIDGEAYAMAPGPSGTHQSVVGNLYRKLADFLDDKPCKVYFAPYDVRLNADTYDDTVVQPDIVVVCDKTKLDDRGCKGVPDMVLEIISPYTARYDRLTKLNLYQKSGVREYWIVDPDSKTVAVHILENGKYTIAAYGDEDVAPVNVLEGCEIVLADVFDI
jgi:Uma2 family endonuclease